MGEKAFSSYSLQDYLELEGHSEIKHEFHDGFISASAGETAAHSQISMSFGRHLGNALEHSNKSCTIFGSDMRVNVSATNRFYYPDVSVMCGKMEMSEKDANSLTNPILIVEVLSESTALFDRGTKFTHYRQIPTLREYILVSQTEPVVDTFFRTTDGTWEINTINGFTEVLLLKSVGCEINMADIYRRVPGIDPSVS